MRRVESVVVDALHVLELLGVVVAILLVAAIAFGIVRSIWRVTLGRTTLVLPFGTSGIAAAANEILAHQLDHVEQVWRRLSSTIANEEGAVRNEAVLVDLGPRGRVLADRALDERADRFISEQPIAGEAIGPINLGGVSVSPDTFFALFYRLRSLVARRTVRGSLHELGETTRVAATVAYTRADPRDPGDSRRERGRRMIERAVLVRDLARPSDVLELLDDLAFRIVKARLEFTSEAERWSAYRAFLEGYAEHMRFLRTGEVAHRDRAIEAYSVAVEAEPLYRLAHYNLGNLLYNRYSEGDNAKAIEHFATASGSPDRRLRALALAALTLAYAQNVHRFGYDREQWASLAEEASHEAVQIDARLEETSFARAWAYQIGERYEDAIEEYERTGGLPGTTPIEQHIKSFAANNRAWISMTVLDDLDTAHTILEEALGLYPNKMVYANLGEIHRRRGNFAEALAAYASARELDPRYAKAINETGIVYLTMARAACDRGNPFAELLAQAERWNRRAVAAVPVASVRQREEITRKFEQARVANGFAEEPEEDVAVAQALPDE